VEKLEPCFEPSGILAEFSNQKNGVTLKFTEPLDALAPSAASNSLFALYPFKEGTDEKFESITLQTADGKTSAFLAGRDSTVSHIVLENPSCSS